MQANSSGELILLKYRLTEVGQGIGLAYQLFRFTCWRLNFM